MPPHEANRQPLVAAPKADCTLGLLRSFKGMPARNEELRRALKGGLEAVGAVRVARDCDSGEDAPGGGAAAPALAESQVLDRRAGGFCTMMCCPGCTRPCC